MEKIKKRFFVLFYIAMIAAGVFALTPQNVQAADSKFVIKKGTLVEYKGSDKNVTIPKKVKAIKSVAFSGCDTVQSVTIPGSVKKIGEGTFSGCPNLKKVDIKKGVTAIDGHAFYMCKKLSSVTIPKSVKEIGGSAFYGTPWLTKKIRQRKDKLVIVNHILIDGRETKGKIKIPKGVTTIADEAFYGNFKVSSVAIPSTVKTVGKDAFAWVNIKKITFPKSVKSIGRGALHACEKLKEITILNPKAKVVWAKKGCYGGTIFDGVVAGYVGDKIIIRGYKGSTAFKLVKQITQGGIEYSSASRFKKVVFKTIK